MRLRYAALAILLVLGAPLAARCQGYWWGYFQFQGYGQWQDGANAWWTDTQLEGHYTLPVVDYRLGSVELIGGAYWDQTGGTGGSHTASGLGHVGTNINLFPKGRVPLTFFFDQTRRGALGESPAFRITRWGGSAYTRTAHFGQWWINYEDYRYQQDWRGQDSGNWWRAWRIKQTQTFTGGAQGSLNLDLMNQGSQGFQNSLKQGQYSVIGPLHGAGTFSVNANLSQGTYNAEERTTYWNLGGWLYQPLTQSCTLTGNANVHDVTTFDTRDRGGAASVLGNFRVQENGSWNLFAGVAGTSEKISRAHEQGWANYQLNQVLGEGGATWGSLSGWSVTADGAAGTQDYLAGDGVRRGSVRLLHGGLSYNDGMPSWASRLAYSFKTLSFERRLAEEFAPGYGPPELMSLRQDYRQRTQSGATAFSFDVYDSRDAMGNRASALSTEGSLGFNHTLRLRARLLVSRERVEGLPWLGTQSEGSSPKESRFTTAFLGADFNSSRGYRLSASLTATRMNTSQWVAGASSQRPRYNTLYFGSLTWYSSLYGRIPVSASLFWSRDYNGQNNYFANLTGTMQWRDLSIQIYYTFQVYDNVWDSTLGRGTLGRSTQHRLNINLLRLFRGNTY